MIASQDAEIKRLTAEVEETKSKMTSKYVRNLSLL